MNVHICEYTFVNECSTQVYEAALHLICSALT